MCTKTFYNHTVMVVHKRSHFGELPYNCVTCGAGFRWGSQLKSHVHVIHPRKKNPQCEMFSCEQCEESFSGLPKLMEHRRQSHSGVVLTESYNLRKPIEKFGTRKIQNFNNGGSSKKKRKTYNATRGNISKAVTPLLPSEQIGDLAATQGKGGEFVCLICNYSTDSAHLFQAHLIYHSGLTSYTCEDCDAVFTSKGSLTKHVKNVHYKDLKHRCKVCRREFSRRDDLRRHVTAVHDKIKSYLCLHCGKAFARSDHLKTHERTHTLDKPFPCRYCDKRFTQSSILSEHVITIHTREFPHVCEICHKGYLRPGHLRSHYDKKHFHYSG